MATTAEHLNDEYSELTRAELIAVFDQKALKFLGISGSTFIQKLEQGELSEDNPAVAHVSAFAVIDRTP